MIPHFRLRCPLLVVTTVLGIAAIGPVTSAAAADPDAEARFILTANCQKCHGPTKQKGGLRLDSRGGAVAKGDSGSLAITPGKAASSEVIRRVTAKDAAERMPPDGAALTADQIDALRKWIDAGAAWPKDGIGPSGTAKTELVVTDEDRRHWAFKPLAKVEPPPATKDRVRTPINRFIFAGLAAKKLSPTPPAAPRVLIRRVTFDLTGLPPTPDEVEAFDRAKDPDAAYEALVDRLLASPHYGERWGRHWLDVARYADSSGYESDTDRPNAYHYRDFVIKALNEDMPFDEFVRRQVAGDEIAPDDPGAVAATGFLAAGPGETLPDNLLEEERQRLRYNELDDMVSTTGAALLGLTVGCARCHDHKFDPIPTRDYYRLLAGFRSGNRAEVPLGTRAEVERTTRARADWDKKRKAAENDLKTWLAEQRTAVGPKLRAAKIDKLPISGAEKTLLREEPNSPEAKALAKKHERALAVTDDEVRTAVDDAARRRGEELAGRLAELKKEEPKAIPSAFAFKDFGPKPAASWLFRRGDFHDHTIPVELGFLTVLTRGKPAADYWREAKTGGDRGDTTYQRRAIAAWIADADRGAGPLLARVIVNRIWQHHFGEGLVRTPNDFGARGDRPTHPELLEWLANDLVAHGWKLKRLHRMILLSATYRQGSTFDPQKSKTDPDNRLLWRMRPRRLEAEVLRDSLLAVSGTLNTEMYGPAFKAPIPTDAMVARNLKDPYPQDIPDTAAVRRRSVYLFHKRVIPHPLLQAFDAPDAQQCTGRRANTTVVPQALTLLNDPFVRARASDFAARLVKESGDDPAKCVERAYRLAFSRTPIRGGTGGRRRVPQGARTGPVVSPAEGRAGRGPAADPHRLLSGVVRAERVPLRRLTPERSDASDRWECIRPAPVPAPCRGRVRAGRARRPPESRRFPRRCGRTTRAEGDPFPRQGEGGDLAVHGGRAERVRPVRPEAGVGQERREASEDRRLQRQPRPTHEVALQVPPVRPERNLGVRQVPRRREARGRTRLREVPSHGVERPRPGPVSDQHRDLSPRVPVGRIVGDVRIGKRDQNLPGFVVLGNRQGVKGGPINWSSGFLPSTHQGTLFRPEGNPVLNLRRPKDVTADDQRAQLDLMAKLNGAHLLDRPGEPDLSARIESFELAYRMQSEAADLLDLSKETATTRKMYGLDDAKARSFGTKCLTARRLIERGVRFVQVYSDGEWDAHSDLAGNHASHCAATDVPIDGLLTDLKTRGLLDSTLVIWGGEFGRMPVSQGNGGTTTRTGSWPGWPGRGSRAGRVTARPTSSGTRP